MIRVRNFVLRMRRNGTIIKDDTGWSVEFMGRWWLAHFGEAWRDVGPETWAVGDQLRDKVLWYTPKGAGDGVRRDTN